MEEIVIKDTKSKMVQDYLGNSVYRSDCKRILGKYYITNKQVFNVEGTWYRVNSNKIVYDWENKKYLLKETAGQLTKGLVENEEGEIIEGYFRHNSIKNIKCRNGKNANIVYCIDNEVANKAGYFETNSTLEYYSKFDSESDFKAFIKTIKIPSGIRTNDHSLNDNLNLKKSIEDNYKLVQFPVDKTVMQFSRKYLNNITFGFEAETANGFLHPWFMHKYGVRSLKDGSLHNETGEGLEFVSVPLQGDRGIQNMKIIMNKLGERTYLDTNCSLHFHIGGYSFDRLYIVSLYNLCLKIQDELFKYFPYSRVSTNQNSGKQYAKPLKNFNFELSKYLDSSNKLQSPEKFHSLIVNDFNKIFTYFSNGKNLGDVYKTEEVYYDTLIDSLSSVIGSNNKNANDILDKLKTDREKYGNCKVVNHYLSSKTKDLFGDTPKWNINTRYHWVNFFNLFFNKHQSTVEWRIHEATTNFDKSLNWLTICKAIMDYANNYKECISNKNVSIDDILREFFKNDEKSYTYLKGYLDFRKGKFYDVNNNCWKDSKLMENLWLKQDGSFNYSINNIKSLVL
jgi:hypothetical protein